MELRSIEQEVCSGKLSGKKSSVVSEEQSLRETVSYCSCNTLSLLGYATCYMQATFHL